MKAPKSGTKGKGIDAQALKTFRSSVAKLKRKGIVSKRVDARSQRTTRYMVAKVKAYQDVLEGRAIAVKAPRAVRESYSNAEREILPVRGQFVIAPKQFENQRARLKRGLVQIIRPLRNGQEEYVILPFKPIDMEDLITRMKSDPTLDGLKEPDEYFSFRIGENNSQVPFIDASEMADYMMRYEHLFRQGKEAIKLITFQRFRTKGGEFMRNPHESAKPKIPYNSNVEKPRRNKGSYELRRDAIRANRKAAVRAKETPTERQTRLDKQRIYQAQYRQRMFENN
jgi:hypothetical protein